MPVCHACQRTFKSKQRLFAHLKHCKQYAENKAQNKANGFPSGPQQDRGPQGVEPNQASSQARAEDPMDLFKSFLAGYGQSSGVDPSTSPKSRRRPFLQEAKQQAIDAFCSSEGTVTPAMRGEARRAIEIELSKDPLEEFPWTEILERATAIRDSIYASHFQQEREAHERQQGQTRDRLEQALREQRLAEQNKWRKTLWLELARSRIAAGCERRGLSAGVKVNLELLVEQRMDVILTGQESEQEAEEIIEFILTQQFQIVDEQNGGARLAGKRRHLAGQLTDAAIALAPLGIAFATPLIQKGFNWMEDKLKHPTSPAADASSQDPPKEDAETGPPQHTVSKQAECKSHSSVRPSTAASGQDQAPSGSKTS